MQKKRLIPIFRKAKEKGKKTAWKIIDGDYQLFIEGEQFLFEWAKMTILTVFKVKLHVFAM